MARKADASSGGNESKTSTRRYAVSSLNKVILVGFLGANPTLRSTPKGTPVANFSLATTGRFTNAAGEKQERTEWHRIVAWKRLAKICDEYLKKGKQVLVQGRIQTRSWNDKDGNTRYMTEIVMTEMTMLGKADTKPSTSPPADPPDTPQPDDASVPDTSADVPQAV